MKYGIKSLRDYIDTGRDIAMGSEKLPLTANLYFSR